MEITPTIKYVGVDDLDIDLFESQYVVPEGMSYNSYVILDEKVAIMDTVDARKSAEWWANVEAALAGRLKGRQGVFGRNGRKSAMPEKQRRRGGVFMRKNRIFHHLTSKEKICV